MGEACQGDGCKPYEGYGTKEGGNACGAAGLDGKEANDDCQSDREHIGVKSGCYNFQAFNGRENRDCWSDHRVAIEQRCADHGENGNEYHLVAHCTLSQRHEGQSSAFAFVVGIEKDRHIFHGDDENEGPDDEGENAQNYWLADEAGFAGGGEDCFADCVEGAGSDISVNDADGTQGKNPETWRLVAANLNCGIV